MEGPTISISLDPRNAYDALLLTPPSQRKLGGERAHAEHGAIEIRIAQRPRAINLRTLYELQGRKLPTDLEIYRAYDIWLVLNAFSVFDRGGMEAVSHVGFQMVYEDSPKVTILGILPRAEFVEVARMEMAVDLGVQGELREAATEAVLAEAMQALPFGASFRCGASASFAGRLQFTVVTPRIQAIGAGDNLSEWLFERPGGKPLLGDQDLAQVVLVPTLEEELRYTAQVYANIRSFGIFSTKVRKRESGTGPLLAIWASR